MAKHYNMFLSIIAILVIVLTIIQPNEACRLLDELDFFKGTTYKDHYINDHLHLQALPKGDPVGPPAPNGCTYTPGSGGNPCRLKNKGFARHTTAPPPPPQAYPKFMPQFGVAT